MAGLEGVRTLVTGASGFIGSHLVRRLISEKADVYAAERYVSTLKTPRLADIWGELTILEANLRDFKTLQAQVKRADPDVVFHLGAYTHVGRSFEHADEAVQTNIQGTVNMLHALEGLDFDRFIHTGTSEIYGNCPVPFTEDMQVTPVSPYSISKYAGENFARLYHSAYGYPVVLLRPFNAYGPRQSPNRIIPEAIVSALKGEDFAMTEGKQTREFNYVDDLVDGFIAAAQSKKAEGEIINLGCGEEYSMRDIVEKVLHHMGDPVKAQPGAIPYRPAEVWRMYCDNTKAKKLLDWEPKTTIDDGLAKTINWFKNEYKKDPKSIYFL